MELSDQDRNVWLSAGRAFSVLQRMGEARISRATFYRWLQSGLIPHSEHARPFRSQRRVRLAQVRAAVKHHTEDDNES